MTAARLPSSHPISQNQCELQTDVSFDLLLNVYFKMNLQNNHVPNVDIYKSSSEKVVSTKTHTPKPHQNTHLPTRATCPFSSHRGSCSCTAVVWNSCEIMPWMWEQRPVFLVCRREKKNSFVKQHVDDDSHSLHFAARAAQRPLLNSKQTIKPFVRAC